MYLEHFGLAEAPFRITPHTEFFFSGAKRGATLDALIYAILNNEGIVKVGGEVGSGKTMLCRVLMERLPPHVVVVFLANPSLSRDGILFAIADELDISLPDHTRSSTVIRALQTKLIELHGAGHQVIALIDEAHAMPPETLEEVRLLSNLETNQFKLLQLVLFGQPELDEILARPHMRQLRERITHSFTLEALRRADIAEYLDFRMRKAGYRGPEIFTPVAVKLITAASLGLTRRVNILAEKSLLAAFADETHLITAKQVNAAISDSQYDLPRQRLRKYLKPAALVVGVVALLTLAVLAWLKWGPTTAVTLPVAPNSQKSPVEGGGSIAPTTTNSPANAGGKPVAPAALKLSSELPTKPQKPVPAKSPEKRTSSIVAGMPNELFPTPSSIALAPVTNTANTVNAANTANASATSPVSAPQAPKSPTQNQAEAAGPAEKSSPEVAADKAVPDSSALAPSSAKSGENSPNGSSTERNSPEAKIPESKKPESNNAVPATDVDAAKADKLDGLDVAISKRIKATQRWAAAIPPEHWFIQLNTNSREKADYALRFLNAVEKQLSPAFVGLYLAKSDKGQRIGVIYGNFASRKAANDAIDKLPAEIRVGNPYPRQMLWLKQLK